MSQFCSLDTHEHCFQGLASIPSGQQFPQKRDRAATNLKRGSAAHKRCVWIHKCRGGSESAHFFERMVRQHKPLLYGCVLLLHSYLTTQHFPSADHGSACGRQKNCCMATTHPTPLNSQTRVRLTDTCGPHSSKHCVDFCYHSLSSKNWSQWFSHLQHGDSSCQFGFLTTCSVPLCAVSSCLACQHHAIFGCVRGGVENRADTHRLNLQM
jgi:hypothetical protein